MCYYCEFVVVVVFVVRLQMHLMIYDIVVSITITLDSQVSVHLSSMKQ